VKTSGSKRSVNSIIDANINRAKEGLRVCEDVSRFVLASRHLSAKIKSIRHGIDSCASAVYPDPDTLILSRDSERDAGRRIKNKNEFSRSSLRDILASNFKRAEESLRVLEEMAKLADRAAAGKFKELRYRTYEAEKAVMLSYAKLP
jgi:hypothetical protein